MKELKETEYEEISYIDFASLKRDFVDLLDSLNINTLTILIDEWSGLDKRFEPISQVYFAEYLKKCFFGTSRICLKISAIEHESQFSDRIDGDVVGLEIGGDIFDDVDLDKIYDNRVINLRTFFGELLFKRLLHCDERLAVLENNSRPGTPIDGFVELIFREEKTFGELIKASGGIPRDFIKIFDAIAQSHDYSASEPWKQHRVREQIIEHSISSLNRFVQNATLEKCVFDQIREVVKKNNLRVFLLPRSANSEVESAIEALFAKRLLHKINLGAIPESIGSKHHIFHVDYGVYLYWTNDSKEDRRIAGNACPVHNGSAEDEVLKFVIANVPNFVIAIDECQAEESPQT